MKKQWIKVGYCLPPLYAVRRDIFPGGWFISPLGFLVLLALLGPSIAAPEPAMAQNGACPGGTIPLPAPADTWPHTTIACSWDLRVVSVSGDQDYDYPCSQHFRHIQRRDSQGRWIDDPVLVVPSMTNDHGQLGRASFYLFAVTSTFPSGNPPGEHLDGAELRIIYQDRWGQVSSITRPVNHYPWVTSYNEHALGLRTYRKVYLVDELIDTRQDGLGGVFLVFVTFPEENDATRKNWGLASWQSSAAHNTFPQHCSIPNANHIATPTPAATPTPFPTPTGTIANTPTPTRTPIGTPEATAPASTPFPTWTPTPYVFPTTRAESTPTPWLPVSLPTVTWPTPLPTIVLADSGGGGGGDTGLPELVNTINDSWAPQIEEMGSWGDPNAEFGVGSPAVAVMEMAGLVSLPISYVKAVGTFMPNAAPYVTYLLILAGFVAWNIMMKFAISLTARIVELVRRILELIPGM